MPVPTPRSGESQQNFISRCISTLHKLDPERDDKQIQAICYSQWRRKGRNGESMNEQKFNCECIKCGYKTTSDQHCSELKCPKCGGQMRRAERPGPGREFIKIPVVEFRKIDNGVLEKVTEYSFSPDKWTEEKAKKWIQKSKPKAGAFKTWCKAHGFGGVNQACVNAAAKAGGHAAKMALFACNMPNSPYHYPKKVKK